MLRPSVQGAVVTVTVFFLLLLAPSILSVVGSGLALIGRLIGIAMTSKPLASGGFFVIISLLYGLRSALETYKQEKNSKLDQSNQ
jgi:hypothetical protein